MAALAGFCLLALVNCGGGGGGGGDSGGGSTVVAGFTATCAINDPCDSNAVTMQKGAANGNVVEVQVRLNKLNTLIGAAGLDIGFDPNSVDYLGYTEGPALGTGSGTTYLVTKMSGEVIVSITPSIPKSLLSPDVMITLSFKVLKVATSSGIFKGPDTLNGSALYRPDKSIILLGSSAWSGGGFSGT